jgi:hypothetical protein
VQLKDRFMSSLKKIAANRRNAQRSTGPRTPEGKSASSHNSFRTGIYAAAETVLPHEDPKAIAALAAEYYAHYQPQAPAERCLVDCLVSDEWLLRRFRRIEGELISDNVTSITGDTRPLGEAYDMVDNVLDRLQRRINATRKSYLKTLEALESLRAAADVKIQPPAPAPRPPAPVVQPLPAPIGFVPPTTPPALSKRPPMNTIAGPDTRPSPSLSAQSASFPHPSARQ